MDQKPSFSRNSLFSIVLYWAKALNDSELQANADFLKSYVDKGWLGVKTGRGFYTYPDPAYQVPGFVSRES